MTDPTPNEVLPTEPTPEADENHLTLNVTKPDAAPKPFDFAMLWWTRVVGVFTGVLAMVGFLQFWAFVQSERAFLSVLNMRTDGVLPTSGERTVRVSFEVRNSGRSTAFEKNSTLGMEIGALPPDPLYQDEPQYPMPPTPPGVISNGHDSFVTQNAVAQSYADAIKSGDTRISIFGYLTYSDDFRLFGLFGDRTIGFCFTRTAQTGTSQFETCPESKYTYVK